VLLISHLSRRTHSQKCPAKSKIAVSPTGIGRNYLWTMSKTKSAIKKHSRLAAIIIVITRRFCGKVLEVLEIPAGPVKYVFCPSKQSKKWSRSPGNQHNFPLVVSHIFPNWLGPEIFPHADFQLVNYSYWTPGPLLFIIIIIFSWLLFTHKERKKGPLLAM